MTSARILIVGLAVGLAVTVEVSGVTPGKHGWHIHQYDGCDDVGSAAGGHYNPDNVPPWVFAR